MVYVLDDIRTDDNNTDCANARETTNSSRTVNSKVIFFKTDIKEGMMVDASGGSIAVGETYRFCYGSCF